MNLAALLISWMCIGGTALAVKVYAQDPSVTGGVTYSRSPGTGHSDGVGLAVEVVARIPKDFEGIRFIGGVQGEFAAKRYLGNGTAARGWGQVRWELMPWSKITPILLGGVSVVNNRTSGEGGYSKTAWFVVGGAGVNVGDKYLVTWEHFFREYQTQNRGASDKFKLDLYLPLSDDSNGKWLARMQVFGQRSSFTQPNGPAAGQHVAWSLGGMLGMGYRW